MILKPRIEILDKVFINEYQLENGEFEIQENIYRELRQFCIDNSLQSYLNEIGYLLAVFSDNLNKAKKVENDILSHKADLDILRKLNEILVSGVQEIVFYSKEKKKLKINSNIIIEGICSKLVDKEELDRKRDLLELTAGISGLKKRAINFKNIFQLRIAKSHIYEFYRLFLIIDKERNLSKDSVHRLIFDLFYIAGYFTKDVASKEATMKKLGGFYRF